MLTQSSFRAIDCWLASNISITGSGSTFGTPNAAIAGPEPRTSSSLFAPRVAKPTNNGPANPPLCARTDKLIKRTAGVTGPIGAAVNVAVMV